MYGKMQYIELTDSTFRVLRDFIHSVSGVFFADSAKSTLESRLQQNVKRRELTNFNDYYYFLKYDRKKDEEIGFLIDAVTIHETYFFREIKQLNTFMEEVVPELAARKKTKQLRILSAGCATGEEPYTLSMMFLENRAFRDLQIEIYATDVSRSVLASARQGLYRDPSFRSIDPYFQKSYFEKEESGYRILDSVKRSVVFLHLNLCDREKWGLLPEMDAIFCRNVIIYFDAETKKNVIHSFYNQLREGGILLLGHSESLLSIATPFSMRHYKNDLLYQKPEGLSKSYFSTPA